MTTLGRTAEAYSPPDAISGDKGWATYMAPRMLAAASADGLMPGLDTPEGAVNLFLASRIRGDDTWKRAMTADPARRAKRSLAKWSRWNLLKAQLRARKMRSENSVYIRVWFEIDISGKIDRGTDEFTVVREAGGWRVSEPPS